MIKNINVLGLFGGASLNSIELSLINTDGLDIYDFKKTSVIPYPEPLALEIRNIFQKRPTGLDNLREDADLRHLQEDVNQFYAESIHDFCADDEFDEIGVDSLTIQNIPDEKCSFQIEKGHALSKILNRRVVTHFHKADLLSGGQASPLSPAFFNAICQKMDKPLLIVDVNTVTSLIFIGESGEMIAFDCAPGTAMIEDWTFRHANMQTDYNGKLAITGKIHTQIVEYLSAHKFLQRQPPKSLDILYFSDKKEHLEGLSLEDGTATATAFIAQAITNSVKKLIPQVKNIYLTGEGARNPSLVRFLRHTLDEYNVELLADFNENLAVSGAHATAFNTARRLYSLPITFPTTTGVYEPMTGGEIYDEK